MARSDTLHEGVDAYEFKCSQQELVQVVSGQLTKIRYRLQPSTGPDDPVVQTKWRRRYNAGGPTRRFDRYVVTVRPGTSGLELEALHIEKTIKRHEDAATSAKLGADRVSESRAYGIELKVIDEIDHPAAVKIRNKANKARNEAYAKAKERGCPTCEGCTGSCPAGRIF